MDADISTRQVEINSKKDWIKSRDTAEMDLSPDTRCLLTFQSKLSAQYNEVFNAY